MDASAWLQSRVTPTRSYGQVPTFLGHWFKPLSVDPGDVCIEDIAQGLAHTFRFGGMVDPSITVAEHAVFVSQLIEAFWPHRRDLQQAGLMHDCVEAYLHDIQSPVRSQIAVTLDDGSTMSWDENDERINKYIGKAFGIKAGAFDAVEVICCDLMAVCFEQRDIKSLAYLSFGLPPIPQQVQHLALKLWSPDKAKREFRQRFDALGLLPFR